MHTDLEDPRTMQREWSSRTKPNQVIKLLDSPKDNCRHLHTISWSTASDAALALNRANWVSWDLSTAP